MAYGARLESVLGESPRGFESPILRQKIPIIRRRRALILHRFSVHLLVYVGGAAVASNLGQPATEQSPAHFDRILSRALTTSS